MRLGTRRGSTPPADTPAALDHAPASRVFLAAAPFVGGQQLFRVIRAFALITEELPGWTLVVAGSGPQRTLLTREIRRAGSTRIHLSDSPVPAAIFVAAPRQNLPDAAFLAMAGGLPIITTDVGQLVPDETARVVAPESNAGLATAMLQLARDPELAARLGAAGQAAFLAARPAGAPERPGNFHDPALSSAGVTPEAARADVVRLALAAAVGLDPVVLPGIGVETPRLVLAQAVRAQFVDGLLDQPSITWLSLRLPGSPAWDERRGSVAGLAPALANTRASWCALEPWPESGAIGQRCGIEIEFWEADPQGTLIAPRPNGLIATMPDDRATTTLAGQSVPTIPLATGRRIGQVDVEIDAVFTWVQASDDVWDQARAARLAQVTGTPATKEASGRARYLDHDELRYALRSIHLFAPWFRRIFLVTAGQRPSWLRADDDRITLVDHRDILPAEALPTFNSQAIETGLHRIEGLAEHFVYFNDDFLIGRPISPEVFFDGGGSLPVVSFAAMPVGPSDQPGAAPYLKSAWSNRRLLESGWGLTLTRNLAHAPYAHRKSLLSRLEQEFPAEWNATALAPFRSDTDLSVASSLAQHVALAEGTAVERPVELAYLLLGSPALESRLKQALHRHQDFLCLGDDHAFGLDPDELEVMVREFLATYFPIPAPWERQPNA